MVVTRVLLFIFLMAAYAGTGCVELGMIADNQPEDGVYLLEAPQYICEREVYVESSESDITLWPYPESFDGVDILNLPARLADFDTAFILQAEEGFKLKTGGFDIDVLTVLFKYRPVSSGFPRQLNSDLSGAIYLGYRNDIYRVGYERIPAGYYGRSIRHFGYSFGVFTGIGSTAMNSWVTNDFLSSEYDGMVWMNGIAGLVGIGEITVGIVLGIDILLDDNRKHWIYRNKPWTGFVVGINLN